MISKIMYWVPRIFTILALLFMMMFSLDVFEGNEPFSRKMLDFLIHNIPVLILAVILFIAWIWEVVGGILLILAFTAASIFFRSFSVNHASLIVIGPFPITGLLFILHHLLYGKKYDAKNQ